MGLDIDSLLVSPQRPRVLITAAEEQAAALKMIGKKRRPRAERNKEKAAPESVMKAKREQLAEAKRDLEAAEKLCENAAIDEATCTAEIDEETPPLTTANFRPCQTVRSEADTATLLSEWATSPTAQEFPSAVDSIEEHGPLGALAHIDEYVCTLRERPTEPLPEAACRMLFDLIFKGCVQGSEYAVKILKQVIDGSSPLPFDDSCYAPSDAKHLNRLSSSLEWVPTDSDVLQALRDLGYVAPDDEDQLPQAPVKEHMALENRLFGDAKQRHFELQSHPLEHNVTALCAAVVLMSDAFLTSTLPDTEAPTPRTPTAAPPFGRSPQLVTAFARLHHDRALTQRHCRRATRFALDSAVALGSDNRAWGTSMATEIPMLLKHMPSSLAISELCYSLNTSLRSHYLRQAVAAHALLALHGFSEAVAIKNVFEVPVKAVVEQLGTAQDIFARCTPASEGPGGKPTGWEVLTTMELLLQVLEPQLQAYMKAAQSGMAMNRAQSLLAIVEPIAKGVEKGLKKRQSVSVMRARLLCTAIVDILRDTEAQINDHARVSLRGKTVIID